jgi:hypothetical protein
MGIATETPNEVLPVDKHRSRKALKVLGVDPSTAAVMKKFGIEEKRSSTMSSASPSVTPKRGNSFTEPSPTSEDPLGAAKSQVTQAKEIVKKTVEGTSPSPIHSLLSPESSDDLFSKILNEKPKTRTNTFERQTSADLVSSY